MFNIGTIFTYFLLQMVGAMFRSDPKRTGKFFVRGSIFASMFCQKLVIAEAFKIFIPRKLADSPQIVQEIFEITTFLAFFEFEAIKQFKNIINTRAQKTDTFSNSYQKH